ncbi:MAG: lecithin--cholesterol acyltransferase [Xenococcaceae cyanobacterium MO_167.B52]|nr:lecithin--cholesterol acyltransferase [Xenococcaceae cyanobacterium MO_167.B52]
MASHQKAPMKDLVVILPGILGSVLQKDGKDFWGVSARAIFDVIRSGSKNLQQLQLKGTDLGENYHDDGIKATRLVADAQIIPGLIKIVDGYSQTSKLITDNFEVTQGDIYNDPEDKPANFYHFPYDWRRDNRINGKILNRLINRRLKTWRESSGNSDGKVILLAHSMGGLISRYHLEVLGGWQDCRALFTFGTPYRGSVDAVNFLANGLKKAFIDLTEAVRSFPSVYQLMPIYSMLQVGEENKRIAEVVNLPNIDQSKAQDALAFHREIEEAVKTNSKDDKYHELFATVPFVGVQQPTLQSAQFQKGKLTVSRDLPRIMSQLNHLADGDGTVPQISAFPIEFRDRDVLEIPSFIAETHGSLQSQSDILLNLLKKLQIAESASGTIEDIRGRGQEEGRAVKVTKGISLSLEDLYLKDEPIVITAKVNPDNSAFTSLKARIDCVSAEKPALNLDFEAQNNEWVLKQDDLTLESGLYRITVQTENTGKNAPNAVHNLFEIADID